jgi:hypothetical protein
MEFRIAALFAAAVVRLAAQELKAISTPSATR